MKQVVSCNDIFSTLTVCEEILWEGTFGDVLIGSGDVGTQFNSSDLCPYETAGGMSNSNYIVTTHDDRI